MERCSQGATPFGGSIHEEVAALGRASVIEAVRIHVYHLLNFQ